MATIMRKMNVISRCEALFRTGRSSQQLAGIYHSYVLCICAKPGMTQDQIAKHLCVNKSSVTRHLEYLEKNGYVDRRPDAEDKRALLVFPTQKMLDIRAEVIDITQEWNCRLAENIPAQELEIFHRVLEQMHNKAVEIVYEEDARR